MRGAHHGSGMDQRGLHWHRRRRRSLRSHRAGGARRDIGRPNFSMRHASSSDVAMFVPVPLPGVLPPPPHSETGGAPEHAHAPTPGQMPSEARKTYSSCPGSSRGGRSREAVTGGPTCSI